MTKRRRMSHHSSNAKSCSSFETFNEGNAFDNNKCTCESQGSIMAALSPSPTCSFSAFPKVESLAVLRENFLRNATKNHSIENSENQEEDCSLKPFSSPPVREKESRFPKTLSLSELRERLALTSRGQISTEKNKHIKETKNLTDCGMILPNSAPPPPSSSAPHLFLLSPNTQAKEQTMLNENSLTSLKELKRFSTELASCTKVKSEEATVLSSSPQLSLLDFLRSGGTARIASINKKKSSNVEDKKKEDGGNAACTLHSSTPTPFPSRDSVPNVMEPTTRRGEVLICSHHYSSAASGKAPTTLVDRRECKDSNSGSGNSSGGGGSCLHGSGMLSSAAPCGKDERLKSAYQSSSSFSSALSSTLREEVKSLASSSATCSVPSSGRTFDLPDPQQPSTSRVPAEAPIGVIHHNNLSRIHCRCCDSRSNSNSSSSTSSSNSSSKRERSRRRRRKLETISSEKNEEKEPAKMENDGVSCRIASGEPLSSSRFLVFDTSSLIRADIGVLNMCSEKNTVCIPYAVLHEIDMQIKHGSFGRRPASSDLRSEKTVGNGVPGTRSQYGKYTLTDDQLKGQAIKVRDWIYGAQQSNRGIRVQKRSEVNETYFRSALSTDDHILGYAVFLKDEHVLPTFFITEDKLLSTKAVAELGRGAVCNYESLRAQMGIRVRGTF